MLRLSPDDDGIKSLFRAGAALVWTMVLWNVLTLVGYSVAIWLIVKLFAQLIMFI